MGSQRSKEDDIHKISISVFVTNFPDNFTAKDLWNTCKQYGYVVDAFIPNRRSKAGKRFGFVRFIKAFDVERLVNNLCTVWVGHQKIHANLARFQRAPLNKSNIQPNIGENRNNIGAAYKVNEPNRSPNSYAHVVNGSQSQNVDSENNLALLLDDSCLNQQDCTCCLMGKVKDFASLSNLKVVLVNEGFIDTELRYMGGYWILQVSNDFIVEGRVAWVEIKGIPLKMWYENTFKRIASKWGTFDDQGDGNFYTKRICINTNITMNILESFKIIYRGKVTWVRAKEVPGWTPDFADDNDDDNNTDNESYEGELNGNDLKNAIELAEDSDLEVVPDSKLNEEPLNINVEEASPEVPPGFTPRNDNDGSEGHPNKQTSDCSQNIQEEYAALRHNKSGSKENFKDDVAESICSGHFKKSNIPRTGGSIINVMKELVKDPKLFIRLNSTVSDYFVMVRGDWVPNGTKLLIISVYAPQELTEKKVVVLFVSCYQWERDVVVMGDFNEVRKKEERFGSLFNVQGVDAFNLFISNTGLEEVSLRGCLYTWCHKSATKMSKLDRFLISKRLMNSCPYISAITLDRYVSDHRPILMRESHHDYGPVPFRFFHYWFEIKGFDKLVEDSWNEANAMESNAMTKLMQKLKFSKGKIHLWNTRNTTSSYRILKTELADLDLIIDKGDGDEEVINKRTNVVRSLQELEKLQSLEAAQKAKIKWAIEGDENSKYYHGILNKKRSQLAIRGILVDGIWKDSPNLVKTEFLSHFKNRFATPKEARLHLDLNFSNMLNSDQLADLEREVTKDEIKRAVWDCGSDKSPGPDGFTFGFYRRYWKIIKNDMVDAVTCFFHHGSFPKGSNSSFIALILKTSDANMVKDFRPISLIRSMYKIIAKILANRLVFVLGDLVNEIQSAFVADRQILDGPFIMNEIIQWCKSNKKQSLVFKVDFEKAFDSVRWDYLDDVLSLPRVRHMDREMVSHLDPSLHISFQRVVDAGMFKGIMLSPSLHLSHLFYAGDAIFMGQWNESNLNTIVHVLDCFHRASGLRINMSKSKLMGISVDVEKVVQAAKMIGCTVEGMVTRLSKWKMKTLSVGDKRWSGEDELERKIIGVGGEGKIGKEVIASFPSIWLNIVKEVDLLKNRGLNLLSFIHKKLGDGSDTLFWDDAWHGDIAFKDLYPRAYALESCKKDTRDWIMEVLVKIFSVASVRKAIDNHMFLEVASRTRWIKEVPIKVNVLAWKIKLDYLPTRLNISRRGMDIESILCPMCGKAAESSRHIFFTCHIARDILHKISRWWDISYMEISSYEEWLEWILNIRLPIKHKRIFEGVCYVMWWHIWSFRNKCIFGSEFPSQAVIFEDVQSCSFYWCRYRCNSSFSWIEWLKNPHIMSL
ncbi:RNA-directed DNA polymerase, eukaryota [Tanacetum coccineum]